MYRNIKFGAYKEYEWAYVMLLVNKKLQNFSTGGIFIIIFNSLHSFHRVAEVRYTPKEAARV
jgi:hypothetical protein